MTEKVSTPIPGIGVGTGLAIGPAFVIDHGAPLVPEYCLADGAVADELARFDGAVAVSRDQVIKLKQKSASLHGNAAEELCLLLDAYIQMLEESRLIRGARARIEAEKQNAEWAVQAEADAVTAAFAEIADPYLASRLDDIREVGNRLIRNLGGLPERQFDQAPEGAVLVAEEMTPADTALIDPTRIAGFVTALGGAQGHTAIMARSMDLPAVLGIGAEVARIKDGAAVVIDAAAGRVLPDPNRWEQQRYQRSRIERANRRKHLDQLRDVPGRTRDGVFIALRANLELPMEFQRLDQWGADGVGLLRSEFMFMNRDDLPGEDEQAEVLSDLVKQLKGRPATVRTLDIGGEKLAFSLADQFAQSPNPALGLRAVRLSLKKPELLRTQLRAILRASAHGPVRVLVPMISRIEEMRQVRAIYSEVISEMRAEAIPMAETPPPLGAMIEIPGAALAADALARVCDFFAIGTNDLIQYTLAIDRADDQVADLYDPLHPAVLKLIHATVTAADRAGIPVSVCGEMAGDAKLSPLLLGLGVKELSMAPASIPLVKERIGSVSWSDMARKAQAALQQHDPTRIRMMLSDFSDLS